MTISTLFCSMCGAANDIGESHCCACGQLLATSGAQAGNRTLLCNRYLLTAPIGSGGFSAVYRARDMREGGREVAIKQITLQGLSAEETIDATTTFNREVVTLSTLNHPQVPRIYGHFSDQDHWYLVLEYIQGQTLEDYVAPRMAQGRPLHLNEALAVGLQICAVLDHLHSRQPPIIYRDLKPSNIMRTPVGKLVLIDFGIARLFTPGQKRDTQPLGSPGYAAPEQYGRGQTDARADIYSLGALLHFLLLGQDPADHLLSLPPLCLNGQPGGAELETFVACMLAADPADRPASVRVVADSLNQIKQLVALRDASRIWLPPTPQEYRAPLQQQQQQQFQHLPPTQSARRGHPTRRAVLIGMSVLAVAASTGVLWWQSQPGDAQAPPTTAFTYTGHQGPVYSIAWSPDGTQIASASSDETVQVWNPSDGSEVRTYGGHTGPVNSICWSPDGSLIVSGSSDDTLQVWGPYNLLTLTEWGGTGAVSAVAWSHNDLYIASAFSASIIEVWNTLTGKIITSIISAETFSTVAWSLDNTRLASGGESPIVMIWDAPNGKSVAAYEGHTNAIKSVAWSPSGTLLASASADGSARIWDVATRLSLVTHTSGSDAVNAVAWSPDGARLASGSSDGTVQVWGASDGKTSFTYTGHSAAVNSVAWSPDGIHIASASNDKTVQVWKAP